MSCRDKETHVRGIEESRHVHCGSVERILVLAMLSIKHDVGLGEHMESKYKYYICNAKSMNKMVWWYIRSRHEITPLVLPFPLFSERL